MPRNNINKKVIVIGIDGFTPKILESMMGRGELPNFSRLAGKGMFSPMQTVFPPQSPVVWTTIATGRAPRDHGIFDFLRPIPGQYSPQLTILRQGKIAYNRPYKAKTFWEVASERNTPATILKWPLTFPATPTLGNVLSGLGTPDLLGTMGRYTCFMSNEIPEKADRKGTITKVDILKDKIKTSIAGPITLAFPGTKSARAPLDIELSEGRIHCSLGESTFSLEEGYWSDWIQVDFKVGFLRHVSGMCRFYLERIKPDFKLYVTPINISCKTQTMPISAPLGYAKRLSASVGDYSTLGLAEDVNALKDLIIDERAFLSGCEMIMEERERIFSLALQEFNQGILACIFDTPDRIQHMFWRYLDRDHPLYKEPEAQVFGEVIPAVYRRLDGILGKALERVDEETLIIVCSDHGFYSYRWSVHLNTWLVQNGLMALKPGRAEGRDLFQDIDWSKTSAFALGLNSLFLNIKGRERQGTVEPDALPLIKEELVRKLKAWSHNDRPVIRTIDVIEQPYGQITDNQAPDLIIGYDEGYRSSWQTAVGGVPGVVIEPNLDKWSGDHCGDPELVPAILLTNERNLLKKPHVQDISPAILDYLG